MFCDAGTPALALGSGLQVAPLEDWCGLRGRRVVPAPSHLGSVDGALKNPFPWKNKRVDTLSISLLSLPPKRAFLPPRIISRLWPGACSFFPHLPRTPAPCPRGGPNKE